MLALGQPWLQRRDGKRLAQRVLAQLELVPVRELPVVAEEQLQLEQVRATQLVEGWPTGRSALRGRLRPASPG